jgi:RecB family exonuclease
MLKTTAGVGDGDTPWLYETGPLPGDSRFAETPLGTAVEAYITLAAHYGGEYATLAAAAAAPAALAAKRAEVLDAVRRAMAADPAARERLRRFWSPVYLRKRGDERALEPFFGDAEFKLLLDPAA